MFFFRRIVFPFVVQLYLIAGSPNLTSSSQNDSPPPSYESVIKEINHISQVSLNWENNPAHGVSADTKLQNSLDSSAPSYSAAQQNLNSELQPSAPTSNKFNSSAPPLEEIDSNSDPDFTNSKIATASDKVFPHSYQEIEVHTNEVDRRSLLPSVIKVKSLLVSLTGQQIRFENLNKTQSIASFIYLQQLEISLLFRNHKFKFEDVSNSELKEYLNKLDKKINETHREIISNPPKKEKWDPKPSFKDILFDSASNIKLGKELYILKLLRLVINYKLSNKYLDILTESDKRPENFSSEKTEVLFHEMIYKRKLSRKFSNRINDVVNHYKTAIKKYLGKANESDPVIEKAFCLLINPLSKLHSLYKNFNGFDKPIKEFKHESITEIAYMADLQKTYLSLKYLEFKESFTMIERVTEENNLIRKLFREIMSLQVKLELRNEAIKKFKYLEVVLNSIIEKLIEFSNCLDSNLEFVIKILKHKKVLNEIHAHDFGVGGLGFTEDVDITRKSLGYTLWGTSLLDKLIADCCKLQKDSPNITHSIVEEIRTLLGKFESVKKSKDYFQNFKCEIIFVVRKYMDDLSCRFETSQREIRVIFEIASFRNNSIKSYLDYMAYNSWGITQWKIIEFLFDK